MSETLRIETRNIYTGNVRLELEEDGGIVKIVRHGSGELWPASDEVIAMIKKLVAEREDGDQLWQFVSGYQHGMGGLTRIGTP